MMMHNCTVAVVPLLFGGNITSRLKYVVEKLQDHELKIRKDTIENTWIYMYLVASYANDMRIYQRGS